MWVRPDNRASCLALLALLVVACPEGAGAVTWPIDSSVPDYNGFNAVLGECRASQSSVVCSSYHNGVDLKPYPLCGTTVNASISGTAFYKENPSNGFTVEITTTSGGYYFYAHLTTFTQTPPFDRWATEGSSIATTNKTGTGGGTECHLHFGIFSGISPAAFLNPLREFKDVPDTTPGEILEVIFRQGTSTSGVTSDGSATNLSGNVDLLVRSHDGSNLTVTSASVSGWYRFVARVDQGPFTDQDLIFNRLRETGPTIPMPLGSAYSLAGPPSTVTPSSRTFWYRGNQDNGLFLSPGPHTLCIQGYGLNLGEQRLSAELCPIDFIVDITGPGLELQDIAGNNFTRATSSTVVKVVGDDGASGSGVWKVTLVGPSFYQTSTNTVVSSTYGATFPMGGGNLAEGAYTAYVVDRASNVTSGGFTTSGPRFFVENALPA